MSAAGRLSNALKFWRRDTRANIAIISGLAAFALVGASALAVDSSAFYVQKRKLQSAVDMAAIAAVASQSSANSAASTALAKNGITPATLSVVPGTYTADPALPASSRFVAGAATNAASVSAKMFTPMLLGRVFGLGSMGGAPAGSVAISATGKAATLPLAAFSLGSRTASLNAGITNAVLSALVGGSVGLTLLDYQALASAKIDMGALLQGIAAQIGGSSGTYADVLGAKVPLATVLSVLKSSGLDTATTAAVASVLSSLPNGTGTVVLGNLINLGTSATLAISSKLPVSVTMSAYDVLSQSIELASAGKTASVDLGVAVPGIAGASLSVSVGPTSPSTAIAPYGTTTTVTTSQVRIALSTSANFAGLGSVSLPVVLDLGGATATTPGPSCTSGSATLPLSVTPSAATLAIGVPASPPPAVGPGPVVSILGLSIGASASASSSSTATQETFVASDVAAGTVKTASSSMPVASLLTSALGNLKLSVGGLALPPLIPSATVSALTSALSSLAAPSGTILDGVARSLGLGIGQADTWVTDLRCGVPFLVQ